MGRELITSWQLRPRAWQLVHENQDLGYMTGRYEPSTKGAQIVKRKRRKAMCSNDGHTKN